MLLKVVGLQNLLAHFAHPILVLLLDLNQKFILMFSLGMIIYCRRNSHKFAKLALLRLSLLDHLQIFNYLNVLLLVDLLLNLQLLILQDFSDLVVLLLKLLEVLQFFARHHSFSLLINY